MGRLQAEEMARLTDQDTALSWHLQSNHYPPISLAFLPVAKQAIIEGNEENWNKVLLLPNGKKLSVLEIIDGLHLREFLTGEILGETEGD